MPKQAFTIECADAKPRVVSDGSIEFNGKTYTPDAGKAFIASALCQTFPTINRKGRCVTAATLELDFGEGEYGTLVRARCSLPNEGVQDYVDIETFPTDAR